MSKEKILAFGASGLVGSRFLELNNGRYKIDAPDITEVDILDKRGLISYFEKSQPQTVINFAAYTNVEEAEEQKGDKNGICFQINAVGAKNVAEVCKNYNVHLVHISTEYVFDGKKGESPYTERDIPNPINWYGHTKYLGDNFVLESGASVTIMRISMPYSAHYELKADVVRFFIGRFQANEAILAISDQKITTTLVDDIANALVVLTDAKPSGIYHVSARNWITPFDFANLIGRTFGFDTTLVKAISLEEHNRGKAAPLLRYSWLDPSKFISEFGENILHSIEEGVQILKKQVDPAPESVRD